MRERSSEQVREVQQVATQRTVLVMAAGTGGHVFPALAIARQLQQLGAKVEWLGTRRGMENELLANSGMYIHHIAVSGLKGSGIKRQLLAPFMLINALIQSLRVISKVRPDCVLGMGGFICGPGGIATKLLAKPLLIHEQNAVAGTTNRLLARFADCILEAFPDTFKGRGRIIYTGNPIRAEIVQLHTEPRVEIDPQRALRILVLGGSQGAAAINRVIPAALSRWRQTQMPEIWQQTGKQSIAETLARYAANGLQISAQCRVEPFITDMANAYRWADLVICRSGASTVSELTAAGLPAILIPYPHHSDQQQLHNANWLVKGGAAKLLEQAQMTTDSLLDLIVALDGNRAQLQQMAAAARTMANCAASAVIANVCLEYANA
ncbi:MAG: undecaprenyldiphospho-muramoylpentapeptide beta-N-acetylglucosaminyltransferase [Gammaproteobacteria bacterium]|nr:undecaprenyldiphospho-muramoylpentapeptide beta-N-acetylglucosaminyltransferase [Gammaproteobacteria bacterium]